MTLTELVRRDLTAWGNVPVVICSGETERLPLTTLGARYAIVVGPVDGDVRKMIRCTASRREGGNGIVIAEGVFTEIQWNWTLMRMMAFEAAIGSLKQSEDIGGVLEATIKAEMDKAAGTVAVKAKRLSR